MRSVARALTLLVMTAAAFAQSPQTTVTLKTTPTPLGLGQNLFEVTVNDSKGQPVADAEVTLLLVMPADPKTKHPEMRTEGKLNNAGKGKYSGIAMVTMAGEWDVTATAVRQGKAIGQVKRRMTALLARPTAPKPAPPKS